ncbi:MAG: NAD(P)H-binding protein [Chloroflexales bacterium]|nr:NAD(P)H-binding protein [Chloroflexales bacterium]
MTQRIVVAGATGYIGSNVARACASAGLRVRALTRDQSRLPGDLKGAVEPFVGEVTQPETLRGLCAGADVLFSSIGMYIINRRPSLWDVDHRGNLALLEEARRAGVGTVVFVSVLRGREMARLSEVAQAREAVVRAIQESGLRYLIFRPTGFFNDILHFIPSICERGVIYLPGDPHVRINPLHGLDFGEEVVRTLATGLPNNWIRSVGGPEVFTREEIARMAFQALGLPPKIRHLPLATLRIGATAIGPFNANFRAFLKFLEFACTTPDMTAPLIGHRRLYDAMVERAAHEQAARRGGRPTPMTPGARPT